MSVVLRQCVSLIVLLMTQVNGDDAPAADMYFRRSGHSIVVVADYLYIHGGEISWDLGNGTLARQIPGFNDPSNQVNGTIALPLAETWTNDTIPWIRTPNVSHAPSFVRSALWPHGDSFYAWGGYTRYGKPQTTELWKFTVNDTGGGEWEHSEPNNVELASGLVRSAGAARAVCKGLGLYLSGFAGSQTDERYEDAKEPIPVPGILTYDLETAVWSNKSTKPGLNEYGTSGYASAACLDGYGQKGVFLTIAGELMANPMRYQDDGQSQVETSTVSLYDVGADRWLKQTISGEAPPRRDRTCVATAQGENGSLDIYMYGGLQWRAHGDNMVYDDIWILSIPAFTWFKPDVVGTVRASHDCVIVGSQLISVGGVGSKGWEFDDRDPWRQGIGVLDLTTMTWADRYSPNSTAYQSPQMVKDWYRDNNFTNNAWSSDEVKHLFTNTTVDGPETVATQPSSQANHLGPIVGGTVAGSVALLAIVGTTFWYLRRRRNRVTKTVMATEAHNGEESCEATTCPEPIFQLYPSELNARPGLFQLEGRQRPVELYHGQDSYIPTGHMHATEISELAGSSPIAKTPKRNKSI